MSVLLLGSTGYIGSELLPRLGTPWGPYVECWTRRDWDMSTGQPPPEEINDFDAVVNCSGLIDLDRAEMDVDYRTGMLMVNAVAPALLRKAFRGHMVHVSSVYALGPTCFYGRTKQMADDYMEAVPGKTLTGYGGWFYGGSKSGKMELLFSDANKKMVVDDDRMICPTFLPVFCSRLAAAAGQRTCGKIYIHGEDTMTMANFAARILGAWSDRWTAGVYDDKAIRPQRPPTFGDHPGVQFIRLETPRVERPAVI